MYYFTIIAITINVLAIITEAKKQKVIKPQRNHCQHTSFRHDFLEKGITVYLTIPASNLETPKFFWYMQFQKKKKSYYQWNVKITHSYKYIFVSRLSQASNLHQVRMKSLENPLHQRYL